MAEVASPVPMPPSAASCKPSSIVPGKSSKNLNTPVSSKRKADDCDSPAFSGNESNAINVSASATPSKPKFKRKKPSATRDFPPGCGRHASPLNPIVDSPVGVFPSQNPKDPCDSDAKRENKGVENGCSHSVLENASSSELEPKIQDIDERRSEDNTESNVLIPQDCPVLPHSSTPLPVSFQLEDKTFVKAEIRSETERANERECLVPRNSSDARPASPGTPDPAFSLPRSEISLPLDKNPRASTPVSMKNTDSSPLSEFPRRYVSAIRDFPFGCGRKAPERSREECLYAMANSIKGRSKTTQTRINSSFSKGQKEPVGVARFHCISKEDSIEPVGNADNSELSKPDEDTNEEGIARSVDPKCGENNSIKASPKMKSHGESSIRLDGKANDLNHSSKLYVSYCKGVKQEDIEEEDLRMNIIADDNNDCTGSGTEAKVTLETGSFPIIDVSDKKRKASSEKPNHGSSCAPVSDKKSEGKTSIPASITGKNEGFCVTNYQSIESDSEIFSDDARIQNNNPRSLDKSISNSDPSASKTSSQKKPKAKTVKMALRADSNANAARDFPDNNLTGSCSRSHKMKGVISVNFALIPGSEGPEKHHSDDEGTVTRSKVRETMRLFQVLYRRLLQNEEQQSSKKPMNRKRPDIQASQLLKEGNKWVNTGKQIVGQVPGVEVGDEFHYRIELCIVGLHRQSQAGIDYLKQGKTLIATSIVAQGGYADDIDTGEVLIYTGQGGNNSTGDKRQAEDQKLERGNLSLKNCIDLKSPVRVIRGFKEYKNNKDGSKGKSTITYSYDGLYLVEKYWQEPGASGCSVFKFQLRRMPNQPELGWKILQTGPRSKALTAREGLRMKDISFGKEIRPIPVVNTVDDDLAPASFEYTNKMIYPSWFNPTPLKGCDCVDGCSDSESCLCAVQNGGELPFNHNGAIVEAKPLVYECGPACKCPPTCHNRVSQHGVKIPLEVFKTEQRGWGVRALSSISSGTFICEYTGELLSDLEAEQRMGNDEYLFDIGGSSTDNSLWDGLSDLVNEPVSNAITEVVEDSGYAIDAFKHGGVGRFINHSCSPNLYAQNVLFDHEDKSVPHIMLFAAENIPPLQELSYHYNYKLDTVRDSDGSIKMKYCYCGSAECTGRLY